MTVQPNLGLHLEFRDDMPHFHGQKYDRDKVYEGHEWVWFPYETVGRCEGKIGGEDCTKTARWTRQTIDNYNYFTMVAYCKEHARDVWDTIPFNKKRAVLAARDWADEFAELLYEMPAPGAKFPSAYDAMED